MELQNMSCSEEPEEELMLPGFRFHPTDEELVAFYLRRKVEKKPISIELIKQIDIYKYDPWDLQKIGSTVGDKEWYFFCIRGRKYRNSIRPNRVTGSGFWKATGIDRPIYATSGFIGPGNNCDCIGLKKSLVYYRGSAGKGTKTDWMMHEFRLPTSGKNNLNTHNNKNNTQEAEIWTICRIFKRNVCHRKYAQDWRDASIIEKTSHLSPKSCSSEYENRDNYASSIFATSIVEQMEKKPMINQFEEKNQALLAQSSCATQAPSAAFCLSPYDGNNGGFFKDCSLDELESIFEFSIDPTLIPGCRYF